MAPVKPGKEKSFLRRKWGQFYTERQIYLRSHGQVQFISFSPLAQLSLALATVALFGWIAFASVNVVFKNHIIQTTVAKSRSMQSAYEERLSNLLVAYEDLQGQLVETERTYETTTEALEVKHAKLIELLATAQDANLELDELRQAYQGSKEALGTRAPAKPKDQAALRANEVLMPPASTESRPQLAQMSSRPNVQHASSDLMKKAGFFSQLFRGSDPEGAEAQELASNSKSFSQLTGRMERIEQKQQALLDRVERETNRSLRQLQATVAMTGPLTSEDLIARVEPEGLAGIGGPFEPLRAQNLAENLEEKADPFDRQVYRIVSRLEELAILQEAVAHLPLALPVKKFRLSSRFGPRSDPFNRRVAFHSGLDFAAAYGTAVHATVAGKVIYAGWRGSYGRFVEIRSANGLTTRFAHLSAIDVEEGDQVEFQQVIGRLGNSGRSSGPHLHYEVRIDGKAYDPKKFIDAGYHVFAQQS